MSLAKRPASSRQDHLVRLYWVIIDALHPSAPPGESPVRAWTVIGDRSADLPDVVVDGGSSHSTTKARTPQGIPGGLMRLEWGVLLSKTPLNGLVFGPAPVVQRQASSALEA